MAIDSYTAYLQQLQQAAAGGGFTGPVQAGMTAGTTSQRVTPEEEAGAYQTAFGGLSPTAGMVPESQLSGYYNLAQPYMFGTGMERINQMLASAGYAPSGTGGIGPQAEMAGRLQASLGGQQAQALIENARSGAQTQAIQQYGVGQSRYGALTRPNVSTTQGTLSGQVAGTGGGAIVQPQQSWAAGAAGAGGAGGAGNKYGTIPGSTTGPATNAWWAGEPVGGWPGGYENATTPSGAFGQMWSEPSTGGAGVDWNSAFPGGVPSASGYGELGAGTGTASGYGAGEEATSGMGGGETYWSTAYGAPGGKKQMSQADYMKGMSGGGGTSYFKLPAGYGG